MIAASPRLDISRDHDFFLRQDDEKNADATVYDLQLDHDDEVQFENPEFVVAVREDNAALARSPEARLLFFPCALCQRATSYFLQLVLK